MRMRCTPHLRALLAGLLAAEMISGSLASEPAAWPLWTDTSAIAPAQWSFSIFQPAHEARSPPAHAPRSEPPSLYWTETAIGLIRKYQQNPLRAARAFALLHAGMHDAYVLARRESMDEPAAEAAVERTAGLMLQFLYPSETTGRYEAVSLTRIGLQVDESEPAFSSALAAGERAARATMGRALADGAARTWPIRDRPPPAPGRWRPTPPLNAYNPLEPLAGEWRTFALRDGQELEPPPPVPFGSEAYWAEVSEVKHVNAGLTDEQKASADGWNLEQGSITPVGVWNLEALRLARERRLDSPTTIALFTALNVAIYDSMVASWHAKYKWWTQRPVTAIRDRMDPDFLPYLITPSFPSYVSGHASVSGAAAAVLSAFFPGEREALWAEAVEAAESRLYGGIHFRHDDDQGLALGRRIGEKVAARLNSNP